MRIVPSPLSIHQHLVAIDLPFSDEGVMYAIEDVGDLLYVAIPVRDEPPEILPITTFFHPEAEHTGGGRLVLRGTFWFCDKDVIGV